MTTPQKICILGTGAWGTALAQVLSHGSKAVTLIAREPEIAAAINQRHENTKYLAGVTLNNSIAATSDIAALDDADIVILATPAQYLRDSLVRAKPHLKDTAILVNTAKGIEAASGRLLSDITAEILPSHAYAVLSGPTFANEVALGLPTAITLATADARGALLAETIRTPFFRPYLSDDVTGVEIAGALKNVIAIACGIVEGKKLGQNARAAVMTRGMAEIKRLGMAKGAKSDTFLGLAGIGDLTLTCNSMSSRNFSLGFELGNGRNLADILASRVTVAEGVATAKAVMNFAKSCAADLPIARAVYHVLYDNADVNDVIAGLLSRHLKTESA